MGSLIPSSACHPIPSHAPWSSPTVLLPKCAGVLPHCGPLHRLFPLLRTLCSPVFRLPMPPRHSDLSLSVRPPLITYARGAPPPQGLPCSRPLPQCLEQRLEHSWCLARLLLSEQLNQPSRRYPRAWSGSEPTGEREGGRTETRSQMRGERESSTAVAKSLAGDGKSTCEP